MSAFLQLVNLFSFLLTSCKSSKFRLSFSESEPCQIQQSSFTFLAVGRISSLCSKDQGRSWQINHKTYPFNFKESTFFLLSGWEKKSETASTGSRGQFIGSPTTIKQHLSNIQTTNRTMISIMLFQALTALMTGYLHIWMLAYSCSTFIKSRVLGLRSRQRRRFSLCEGRERSNIHNIIYLPTGISQSGLIFE